MSPEQKALLHEHFVEESSEYPDHASFEDMIAITAVINVVIVHELRQPETEFEAWAAMTPTQQAAHPDRNPARLSDELYAACASSTCQCPVVNGPAADRTYRRCRAEAGAVAWSFGRPITGTSVTAHPATRKRRRRASAPAAGQGRAAGRNERTGGDNPRPTIVRGEPERLEWNLTPGGDVLIADVANVAGVDRRDTLRLAARHRVEVMRERIAGRCGPAAPTATRADADYLVALHRRSRRGPP